MKRYIAFFIILNFLLLTTVTADAPNQDTFRLASSVVDKYSYTPRNEAQLNSGFDYPLVWDSWQFCDIQNYFVSSGSYLPGDSLTITATDIGYYTTSTKIDVPGIANYWEQEIIYVPPIRIVRRCTDYDVRIITAQYNNLDVTFINKDTSSSFGAFNSFVSEGEKSQGPALVVSVPIEQSYDILFYLADYHQSTFSWTYWVFDFPIVECDSAAPIQQWADGIYTSFECFKSVNLSITLLDGWSYADYFIYRDVFPLPENETIMVDFENMTMTQIGEPLVSFMPEVELTHYDGWNEPFTVVVKTETDVPVDNSLIIAGAVIAIGVVVLCCIVLYKFLNKEIET